jgi:bifunctional non-homologous end joining protein LigD
VAPKARQARGKAAGDGKLGAYGRKRDFGKTSEPAPKKRGKKKGGLRFVVQEHSARRLHWDLRLEHEGVAASWAIPNGIPESPDENRKAIHTEDHPLEYLGWEGKIPKGEYGAGTMKVWDSGTYTLEKWEPAKVMVEFHGERLQGRYALFRAGKAEKDWMIHRIDPPARERDPFPENVVPMLARLSKLPRDDDGWGVEIKWDGVRAIAYCRPGRVELQTRNLNDVSSQYPEVKRISRALGAHDAVLDGEIVAFDENGRPSFERLQQRIHNTDENVVRRRMKTHPVVYVAFDLLYLDGRDLTAEPYERRRKLLEGLELSGESWQTPGHSVGHAKELLAASKEQGLEGVMLKRLDSAYAPGKRTGAWLKVKNVSRQEFVVGGWTPGEGRRREHLGALLVGYFDRDGGKPALRYAGKVGTGFTASELASLAARLAPLERRTSPFAAGPKPPRSATFVEPRLVAEIEFREMTAEGQLRHAAYKGLREDKAAGEVVLEWASDPEGESLSARAVRRPRNKAVVTVEGRELELSNLDKVLYPQTGFTKGELIDWYARIGEVLLPHLRGRPLTLKRYPEGVEGKHFYEKRCPGHRPEWVTTARVWSDRHKGEIDYCVVEDLATLVWLANLADIELHASLSKAAAIERPTAMVFDLDPGAPADVTDCTQVAVWLRGLFEQLGLNSYAKTSGSKGLHFYVPLNGDVTYEQTKPLAKAVAETLERKFPDRVVSQMSKAKRPGRVLIDWSQNDRHKTTVCVYSLRAKARPTVSTPLEWEELEAALAAGDPEAFAFDHAAVLERVAAKGDLFAPLLSEEQQLPTL